MPRSPRAPLAAVLAASGLAAVTCLGPLATPVHAGPSDPCAADLDGSGTVDFPDLLALLAAWGDCDAPPCPEDLDGSGTIGFDDLLALLAAYDTFCGGLDGVVASQLAGRPVPGTPGYVTPRTISTIDTRFASVEPGLVTWTPTDPIDVYVVAHRTEDEWLADRNLVDVRGIPQPIVFDGATLADNAAELIGALDGDGGTDIGVAYDVVIDADDSGTLSAGDVIDGLDGEPGFILVDDISDDGPLPFAASLYSLGTDRLQVCRYPAEGDGPFPIVIISHGNGHQYTWYSYLQEHLATHGYVTMSHFNDTGPGIETASTTTLINTDSFIQNIDTIAGGALAGRVDTSKIAWIGHSRGGEGVVRAYDRIRDGLFNPVFFDLEDIRIISSIAPTDFLAAGGATPGDVPYHLLYGSADGDVSGAPDCAVCQSFSLFERATAFRAATYIQGADHNDFNCCGFNDFCGAGAPCGGEPQIGRPEVQQVTKATYLALLEYIFEDSPAGFDLLHSSQESLRTPGVQGTTIVDRELRAAPGTPRFVLDDFQSQSSPATSSSGGDVTATVSNLVENRLDDSNTTFTWTLTDPMNGMTRGRSNDQTRGAVFDWDGDAMIEWEVLEARRDWTPYEVLSWRSARTTRHPFTDAVPTDLDYTATLTDGDGHSATLALSTYRQGVEQPFRRTGDGSGTGWQNEFETHRLPLSDFLRATPDLDLSNIVSVRFDFGPSHGTSQGRLGIDDLEAVGR